MTEHDAADAAWARFHRRMCAWTTGALAVALVAMIAAIVIISTT